MRQDQKDYFKPNCSEFISKILVAALGEVGVKGISDIIPNVDEFLDGAVEAMYSEDFTEDDLDEMINFFAKFKNKNDLSSIKSEVYINQYFLDNAEAIQDKLSKLQGV